MPNAKKVAPEAAEVIKLDDAGEGPIVETAAKPKRQRPSRAKPKAPAVEVKEPAP